jgi:hypothetical protein
MVLILQSYLHTGCQRSVDALIETGATDPELMADGSDGVAFCVLKQHLGTLDLPERSASRDYDEQG